MIRFVTALLFSFNAIAQVSFEQESINPNKDESKYVSLQDNKVFDVEIIVFAYKTPLPNNKTYRNKAIYDDSQALYLQYKPDNLDFIINTEQAPDDLPEIEGQKKEYTVSIDTEENKNQALVWFEHPPQARQLTAIWGRLSKKQNIIPLVHRAWRQVETPFNDPTYVNIKTAVDSLDLIDTTNELPEEVLQYPISIAAYPDFSLSGMVALSKGRFTHFGHKLNLFRVYHQLQQDQQQQVQELPLDNITENMVFSLSERKQLKTDELHYFDSPWFGSIVKITEYTGAQENEETPQ